MICRVLLLYNRVKKLKIIVKIVITLLKLGMQKLLNVGHLKIIIIKFINTY